MIEIDFTYENLKHSIKADANETIDQLKDKVQEKTKIPKV